MNLAPRCHTGHRKSQAVPLWICNDLSIVKRNRVVGSMEDAVRAQYAGNRRFFDIELSDGRIIRTKTQMFGVLCLSDRAEIDEALSRISLDAFRSFHWVAETAEEIVSCEHLEGRLEVAKRRNEEWQANQDYDIKQAELIHNKGNNA